MKDFKMGYSILIALLLLLSIECHSINPKPDILIWKGDTLSFFSNILGCEQCGQHLPKG
ncbi:MAG: hypothetical protein R3E32_13640 [Chitinophagales bacterium]